MLNYPSNIYRQAIVILGASTKPAPEFAPPVLDASGAYSISESYVAGSSDTGPSEVESAVPESLVFQMTLSSLPVIWESELSQEYEELGQALTQLTELEEQDEWRIDSSVYKAACNIAAVLKSSAIPAPRVFNHGAKSVVFNWSNAADNLYLTVSADQISALISSPERIKRRMDYSANELTDPSVALSSIRAEFSKKPVRRLVASTVFDSVERVD